MRSKLSPSSMLQTQIIDKSRYRKSLDIIDINRLTYRLISEIDRNRIQKKYFTDYYRLTNSIKNRYRFLSENHRYKSKSQLFFFFDFHRLISEITINHRLISITFDTSGMLSSPLGNRRPNCPSAQLPLAEIRRSDDKVFQDFVVGICKGHQNSHLLRVGAFATQQGRDWSYACEFST